MATGISVLSLLTGAAQAATLPVGPTRAYATIADAVGDAVAGDTVEVDPGIYDSSITIAVELELVSTNGSLQTVLTGDIVVDGVDAVVSGFTFIPANRALELEKAATVLLEDAVVKNVAQDTSGIGAWLRGGSRLTVMDAVFQDLAAGTGVGAALWVEDSELVLQDVRFERCSAVDGGAVYAENAGMSFEDVTFTDNSATSVNFGQGGAVFAVDTTADLTSVTFDGNEAERFGGAMAFGGTLIVRGGTWSNNVANRSGGALSLLDSSASLVDVTMTDNAATERMGGHVFASGGDLELQNSWLTGGTAGRAGGAVATIGTAVVAFHGAVDDNEVTGNAGSGGGLYLEDAGSVSLTSVDITRNRAWVRGGGLHLVDSGGTLSQCVFAENDADEGGGVYHNGNLTLLIDGSAFTANTAETGGGVYWDPNATISTLNVRESDFADNEASGAGGAIRAMRAGLASFVGNSFSDNVAAVGAALYLDELVGASMYDNLFCANRADEDGGAAYASELVTLGIRSNRVVENAAAGRGAGLFLASVGYATVMNNDFLANNAARGGGGVWFEEAPFRFENNIVAWTAQGDGVDAVSTHDWTIDYNDWDENSGDDLGQDLDDGDRGPNDLMRDPELASYTIDADCGGDDLALAFGSPLVDAGNPEVLDPDGSRSDIGAYGGPEASDAAWADLDADGVPAMWDCDDTEADAHPGEFEIPWDGIDNDCSEGDACDVDGDGFEEDGPECRGQDCDDEDPTVLPGAEDEPGDGVDQDCDGADRDSDPVEKDDEPRCGCASAGTAWSGSVTGLFFLLLRRRR